MHVFRKQNLNFGRSVVVVCSKAQNKRWTLFCHFYTLPEVFQLTSVTSLTSIRVFTKGFKTLRVSQLLSVQSLNLVSPDLPQERKQERALLPQFWFGLCSDSCCRRVELEPHWGIIGTRAVIAFLMAVLSVCFRPQTNMQDLRKTPPSSRGSLFTNFEDVQVRIFLRSSYSTGQIHSELSSEKSRFGMWQRKVTKERNCVVFVSFNDTSLPLFL